MSLFSEGTHTIATVTEGSNTIRVPNLKSGTLYAILAQGKFSARTTDVLGASSQGSGYSLIGTLNDSATTLQTSVQTECAVSAPNSYFVAGGNSALSRYQPQVYIDQTSSSRTQVVFNVAAPSFNVSTVDSNVSAVRCKISRDGGETYSSVTELTTPFADDAVFATFTVAIPESSEAYVIFQCRFKDGTLGPVSRPIYLYGLNPATTGLAAPTINSVSGEYAASGGVITLSGTFSVTADPNATDIQVQLVSGGTVYQTASVANESGKAVTLSITGISTAVSSYTINAYSVKDGNRGQATSTVWNLSSITAWTPTAFNVSEISLSEVISRVDGSLHSSVLVDFSSEVSANAPQGKVYLRLKDSKDVSTLTLSDFTYQGIASGTYVTGYLTAGSGIAYQVVVLAVGVNGSVAAFTSAQVQSVDVFQYDNYVPPKQAVPTVTVLDEKSMTITGTYTRLSDTPEPVIIKAFNSETLTGDANLITYGVYDSGNAGVYSYTLTIPDFYLYTTGTANTYAITLRTLLENNGITATANKTTIKIVKQLPSVPVLGYATAYVKTLRASATAISAMTSSQTTYTPTEGGNGLAVTIAAAASTLMFEIADAATDPGTSVDGANGEYLKPSLTVSGTSAYVVMTPSNNSGTHNVRAKWMTLYDGNTGWSNMIQATFPTLTVVDATAPNLSTCLPRFVCNSDGTITLSWTSATFGTSGLGSYIIKRSTTNSSSASTTVGMTSDLTWTDYAAALNQGKTYYYWLAASNAQGVLSATVAPVKLSSANSYAVETTVAAVATDAVPATVGSITATGATGGFSIVWSANSETDIKDYYLEYTLDITAGTPVWTAIGYIASTTYFHTGALASQTSAVAANYRWRVKARDYSSQLSAAALVSGAPDLANYGTVTDATPSNPTSVSYTVNTDASITLSITGPADSTRVYYKVVRLSYTGSFADGDSGPVVEASVQISSQGTTTTFTDTGLNFAKYYAYRVYACSKLGTSSTNYVTASSVKAQYTLITSMKTSLVTNGHFGTAAGAYGTSSNGWTLTTNTALGTKGSLTVSSASYYTACVVYSGVATAAQMGSQVIQVVPGKKYTVLGLLVYKPTTNDGRGYLRILQGGVAAATSDASNGVATIPLPYSVGTKEAGVDYTTAYNSTRFIQYSFTASATATEATIAFGFENRTATDGVSLYLQFIQVFLDE